MQNKSFFLPLFAIGGVTAAFFILSGHPHEVFINAPARADKPTSTTPLPGIIPLPSSPQPHVQAFDTTAYDAKLLAISNLPIVTKTHKVSSTIPGSSTIIFKTVTTTSTAITGWPVKDNPYPLPGALLPFKRIVAYYGNLYSKGMGVLGEYPSTQMLAMLTSTTAMWAAADPSTETIPALHYIVSTAQGSPGVDGKYSLLMPDDQVDKILALADQIHAVVFLDFQVGRSSVQAQVPLYEKYFKLPNVHLGLDPEFAMHNKTKPGTQIGTMDAADINFAAQYLAKLVHDNNLPPKVLIIHRFTEDMVTNYKQIKPLPEVQIVMDMDGFGFPAKKINTYQQVIIPEPVQFTGFKLFYKNDAEGPDGHLMTPKEVLKLSPQPSYIQYQ
jgi:hypothetical protein